MRKRTFKKFDQTLKGRSITGQSYGGINNVYFYSGHRNKSISYADISNSGFSYVEFSYT